MNTTSPQPTFLISTTLTQQDKDSLKLSVGDLYAYNEREGWNGNITEGVLMAGFTFSTGTNHEADDAIDACFPFIEKAIGATIDRSKCLRLEVNRNKQGEVGMLLAAKVAEGRAACLVVMGDGTVYFLPEATHKPYFFVRGNGKPLVTFACDMIGGGFKSTEGKEMRGIFDGDHYMVSSEMTSCLPSKIGLTIAHCEYNSTYYKLVGDNLLFRNKKVEKCTFEKKGNVLYPKVTEM